jgi:hypothetical protein
LPEDYQPKSQRSNLDAKSPSFTCSKNGLTPHETYCEKYYNCSGGNPTPEIWECKTTVDFLFSDKHLVCDYAYDVHCGPRIRPDDVSNTIRPPPTTTTTSTATPPYPVYNCTWNGAYPHPLFCEMYYDCWNGISTLLKCPNETLFDTRSIL